MAKAKLENWMGAAGNPRMCDKPTAVYGRRVVAIMGEPKWERRRLVDPEYKDVLHVSEGWYVNVYMMAERDHHDIGVRYVPLIDLRTMQGQPYPVPDRPSDAPKSPVPDRYFKVKEEKTMSTIETPAPNAPPKADLRRLLALFAGKLFDRGYAQGQGVALDREPPAEVWRALQPPHARELRQNRFDFYTTATGTLSLWAAAMKVGEPAVYRVASSREFYVVSDRGDAGCIAVPVVV